MVKMQKMVRHTEIGYTIFCAMCDGEVELGNYYWVTENGDLCEECINEM